MVQALTARGVEVRIVGASVAAVSEAESADGSGARTPR